MKLNDKEIKELKEMYPNCPNPKHHPIGFQYYLGMYLYFRKSSKVDTYA